MPGSLAARNISKSYAAVQVLDDVSLVVAPGDRVGIVGPNGIGKSTLLRVLAGLEAADAGRVIRAGAVGYLPQELEAAPAERSATTSRGARESAAPSGRWTGSRRGWPTSTARGAYTAALDRFLALGGQDFDARAASVLDDVGLGRRSDREVRTLSGGEAARAALAAMLLSRFDVFLLDEPTNNLDFAGLERLEQFLHGLTAGAVLVSHDRDFLDRTINGSSRSRRRHGGCTNTAARGRNTRRRASAPAPSTRPPTPTISARGTVTRRCWKTGAARHTRSGERKLARQTGGSDRRATNALRGKVNQARNHLERLEEVEKPWSPWRLQMEFAAPPPTGTSRASAASSSNSARSRSAPSTSRCSSATALQWSARTARARRR